MAVVRRTDAGQRASIFLEGVCPVEDAETLASLILEDPSAPVDWTSCTRMHTAVYQVLVGLRSAVSGTCGDLFVDRWLTPLRPDDATAPALAAMPRGSSGA